MTLPLETAAVKDEYARRALDIISQNIHQPLYCRMHHNANQAFGAGGDHALSLNTFQAGSSAMADTTNGVIRIVQAGIYLLAGQVDCQTGGITHGARISVSGTLRIFGAATDNATNYNEAGVCGLYPLAAGDTVGLTHFTSGAATSFSVNGNMPQLSAYWLGKNII